MTFKLKIEKRCRKNRCYCEFHQKNFYKTIDKISFMHYNYSYMGQNGG